jgi:hypothetical protein
MNKTFKVIFSKVLGKHVVVSELVNSQGKGGKAQKVVAGVLASVALAGTLGLVPMSAGAQDATAAYYSVNSNGKDLGNQASDGATGAYSVAAGADTQAQGTLSTVVGSGSNVINAIDIGKIREAADKGKTSTNENAVSMINGMDSYLDKLPVSMVQVQPLSAV